MLTQPPDVHRLAYVLDRCRELHGGEVADLLAQNLAEDWNSAQAQAEGPDVGIWCAAQQLLRAVGFRAAGHVGLANMTDHLAECCVRGWRDEVTVRTTEAPDHG